MFKESQKTRYHNITEGTWGEFQTSAGKVAFVLSKARLGKAGADNAYRLTSALRPVREVLDFKTLDFNQLLQRDLDDHRVATELVKYLLVPQATGPAFFPPIVAVLLPFEGNDPAPAFPEAAQNEPALVEDENGHYLETSYGAAFKFQILATGDGDKHPASFARLHWNDEHAKLVVIDGQHRAMALLAVDRSLNKTWDASSGTQYRHFYEHRVRDFLAQAKKESNALELNNIEFPVLIAWFPDLVSSEGDPHKAARKLFVDLNKEAKPPSEARLVLLSDSQLENIFTRALLNRLREDDPPIPLYAIEYDNPDKDAARPVRWNVLTNLALLKAAIQCTLFCPKKYLTDMSTRFRGKPPEEDERMRSELQLRDVLPAEIDDGDRSIERQGITNRNFPASHIELLTSQFMDSWGNAILALLGSTKPYKDHCTALKQLDETWLTDDATARLAYDALFVGVGMFWTLRASDDYWQNRVKVAREQKAPLPPKPDIVRAWDSIKSKSEDFEATRAMQYLGKGTEETREKSKHIYGILNTNACQLGAFLTLATLADISETKGTQLVKLAEQLGEAWSKGFSSPVNKSRDRKLVFAKEAVISHPLNRVRKMDTPLAVYFRYFWLELLLLDPAWEILGDTLDRREVEELASKARSAYLSYLIEEQAKSLKRSSPGSTGIAAQSKLKEKAKKIETEALFKALKDWFCWTREEFDQWSDSIVPENPLSADTEDASHSEEDGHAESDDSDDLNSETEDENDGEPSVEEILNRSDDEDVSD